METNAYEFLERTGDDREASPRPVVIGWYERAATVTPSWCHTRAKTDRSVVWKLIRSPPAPFSGC